ncbi:MAG: anion permease, partial [Phycisphaerales bacterium]|nr:anion permease [Phycisphaerales bacterium]
ALAILVAMVLLATVGPYAMLVAAMLGAGAMVATRCCTITEARRSIDWSILIVIGAALGVGEAMASSGAASWIAGSILSVVGQHPWLLLAMIYVTTSILTEVVTNNAAVALVFPLAMVASARLEVEFTPFIIAIMMAGSASFATPLGYQTNLMVYGPGRYTFGDFLRVGLPMNVLVGIVTVALTPLLFPF